MDFRPKLSSGAPSSIYTTDFLSPKSTLKQLTFHSSPVFGRCISEIKISSEKSSPLPTPISMNFSKPKTPTCVSRSSFVLKRPEKIEQTLKKIETYPKIKLVKPKKKKLEKQKKFETKKISESKLDPVKEKAKKNQEKNKLIKDLGNNIRKMNLKFSKKRFVQKAKWGSSTDQPSKFSILEKIPLILLKKPKKFKEHQKSQKKKVVKKTKSTLPTSRQEPSRPVSEDSIFHPLRSEKFLKKITKIQAAIRGWLIRKKIKYLKEPKFSLEFSNHVSVFHSSSLSHQQEDYEVQNILSQKLDQSFSNLYKNLRSSIPSNESLKQDPSKEHILSAQITLRVKQSLKLKELQMNDMQEMKAIAEKFCNKDEIIEVFSNIIQRRYEKLSSFFDKSIQKLQSHLYLNYEPVEELDNLENFLKYGQSKCQSVEIGDDIEKMLQEIEKIEDDEANSFLCDPQPLPPLTPIYEELREGSQKVQDLDFDLHSHTNTSESEQLLERPSKKFSPSPEYFKINKQEQEFEPVFNYPKSTKFFSIPASSSNTIENSEAIRDFSSIATGTLIESGDNSGTLQKDLGIKPVFSIKKTIWPSSAPKFLDQDSLSNPFSITNDSCKIIDLSEEDYLSERVVSLLELVIYHDFIENHIEAINDTEFVLNLTEYFIIKNIESFISESTRPKMIEHDSKLFVKTDSINILHSIDAEFTTILRNPEILKSKIFSIFNPITLLHNTQMNEKINYLSLPALIQTPESDDPYSFTHLKAVFGACSQAIVDSIFIQKSTIFDFVHSKVNQLKLSDFFISIREVMFRWNELQAGNIPSQETLKADGELDEDKLQSLRIQSLAKLLYQDLEEDSLNWVNYLFEEEQAVIDVEKSIFLDLVFEVLEFL